jgi:GDP-D-mannose dehydratase
LFRPTDISEGKGIAAKAERVLSWKARAHLPEVIDLMVQAELDSLQSPRA